MKKKALNYRSLYFEDLAGHYESIEGHPAGLQIIFFLERKFVRLSDHFGRTKQKCSRKSPKKRRRLNFILTIKQ